MSAADLPTANRVASRIATRPITYRTLLYAVFAMFIFGGSISLIEPSPYDFLFIIVLPMWLVAGFRLPRMLLPIIVLWIVYDVAGFIALTPYWTDPDAVKFQLQSLYLIFTVIFFTLFFAERTEERLVLCLRAYTAGAIFCCLIGVAGWLDLGGLRQYTTMDEGRLSATFKDANVLGSYLILSELHLTQGLLLGRLKRIAPALIGVLLIFVSIFLSFSRGSWGASVVALIMMAALSFMTAQDRRERRRIAFVSMAVLGGLVLIVATSLLIPAIRDMFFTRAALIQSYDVGEQGRFGNQLRSLPMLLQLPNGFGPLRFRIIFGLEPHNSYINAFASYGWIGGFAWLIIVGMTIWVGFRLCLRPSPYRRLMHVYWPTAFVLLMQGFQIDIDHWRQLFLCFGAVWGTEAARVKWLRAQSRPTASRRRDAQRAADQADARRPAGAGAASASPSAPR